MEFRFSKKFRSILATGIIALMGLTPLASAQQVNDYEIASSIENVALSSTSTSTTYLGESENIAPVLSSSWGANVDSTLDISTSTIVVDSAAKLARIAEAVNSGNNLSGKTIIINGDLDLSAHEWVPIGTRVNPFAGTLTGESTSGTGVKITGLYCGNADTVTITHQGLVGSNDGTIKNIGIESGRVEAYNYAGALAGYNAGTIENCYNKATVIGNDSGRRGSGGIAGMNGGSISNSYNKGYLESKWRTICGIANNDGFGTIANTYNVGEVKAADDFEDPVNPSQYWSEPISYNATVTKSFYAPRQYNPDGILGSHQGTEKTIAQFENGSLISELGTAYKQTVGIDSTPKLFWE